MTDKIRLLVCRECRTIEELPDFKGHPDDDVLLAHLLPRHRFPSGEPHLGNLFDVEKKMWEDHRVREEIISQIQSKTTGLDSEFYATKNTFQADALTCYGQHNRPKQGCIDYKDDRKRLGNPSAEGWKRGPKVYLCDFCPVKTYVMTEQRHKAGMYRERGE